ncbi:hypothetical protein AGMMS49936_09150 [Endomicrobiia bacterium]|nr:hypothetical protein AGMMS49936_09150 [Endomicrobiia bacterium]
MKKSLVLLLSFALVTSSCASVYQGKTKSVAINSTTQDAEIYVDGNFVGSDSVNVKLKRDRDHAVVVKKMGFQTKHRNITSNLQEAWLITDIILGTFFTACYIPINFTAFIIPIVEAATGAWYELSPDNISVDLEPEQKK